jgi:hypothetical protein
MGTENNRITDSAVITSVGHTNIIFMPIRLMSPIFIATPSKSTIMEIDSILKKKLILPILFSFLSEKYRSLVQNLIISDIKAKGNVNKFNKIIVAVIFYFCKYLLQKTRTLESLF